MNEVPETTKIDGYKYRIFCWGFLLLLTVEVCLEYAPFRSQPKWTMDVENLILPVAIAYLCEKYAQFKLRVHLRWAGEGVRQVKRFLLYVFGWSFALWFALPGITESRSVLPFLTNAAVIYLFAGAWFEICNLIKVDGDL